MKKLLLITALLMVSFTQAQEVSPYYPAKITVTDPFNFTSQLTYYDLNFITVNISEFLSYRMNMVVEKDNDSKLLSDGGTYTITYTDKLSQSGNKKLIITYIVGLVDTVYTIQSVKISGSKDRVIDFFIEFWQTTVNFEEPTGNSDVSLLTGQDVVKFYFNKGNPYIAVSNSAYKSLSEFKNYFKTLKASN
jgi:hypothetical protein